MKAAYNPTNGDTPATKAKAIASGTSASETVSPAKSSTPIWFVLLKMII